MDQIYSDAHLTAILKRSRVIACVGISMNPARPSHMVARYLGLKGYRVIPINPGHAGKELFGEEILPDLASIPKDAKVDMVDIFRRSEHVLPVVEAALAQLPDLKTVWMQIGVENTEARALAQASGCDVIENLCPKLEYPRLFGEQNMDQVDTGLIISKL